jgi:hypothetical protein
LDGASSTLSPKAAEVIKTEFNLLPESTTPSKFNDEFLSKHSNSASHVLAAHRVRKQLPSNDQKESEAGVLAILSLSNLSLEEAIEGLDTLSSWNSSTQSYSSKAHSRWPEATIFKPSE